MLFIMHWLSCNRHNLTSSVLEDDQLALNLLACVLTNNISGIDGVKLDLSFFNKRPSEDNIKV